MTYLCAGAIDGIYLNDTISRNKFLIPGEVISTIINECDRLATWLTACGISTTFGGGKPQTWGT